MSIKSDKIWMDGKLIDYEDAKVHVLTHTLHYGYGVFEGIRAYRRSSGESHVFRRRYTNDFSKVLISSAWKFRLAAVNSSRRAS